MASTEKKDATGVLGRLRARRARRRQRHVERHLHRDERRAEQIRRGEVGRYGQGDDSGIGSSGM